MAVTAVAAATATASFAIAVLGQIGILEPAPLAWLGVAAAGVTGVRLLVFAYARVAEPPDRRVIGARLR
ncbi:MAG TPA: hypothetical protein VHI71_03945 [Actinomycetota bacterium]|nr:hypothetical protein [Actinomycetota bacterium]